MALVAAVLAALPLSLAAPAAPAAAAAAATPSARSFLVTVPEAPGSTATIRLDATFYTPATTPAPAVLLAHGFGQDKTALAAEARRLQGEGYAVLAYSARGFGASGGSIGLDSLDGEVPDARAMVDVLDRSTAVLHRRGDPVVGIVGGSYGGALALMAGATDTRVDTVVAAITWHDLADALAPRSAGTAEGRAAGRDFKVGWASRLFGAGITASTAPCGRFTASFCDLYRRLVTGGTATGADLALLARSSPSSALDGMRAPTLLLQGEQDRLFGLDQADANARQLAAAGAPVTVRWFDGGHDGGGIAGTDAAVDDWLDAHLRHREPTQKRFVFDVPASTTAFQERRTAARYPGLAGAGSRIALRGGARVVVNPPGGLPASVTGIPGLDGTTSVGRTASRLLSAGNPAEEAATFLSAPLRSAALLAGAPTVRLRVAPTSGGGGTAVLYAQLSVRTGDAERALPGGVAPIRVALPEGGESVAVTLPATAWSLAPGDRLALTVRTSDTQFVGSREPAAYRIAVEGPLALPSTPVISSARSAGLPSAGVLVGIGVTLAVALLLLLLAAIRSRSRRRRPDGPASAGASVGTSSRTSSGVVPDDAPPLVIRGLTKRFRSGFLAVDDVAFEARRGQVVGLLGENGAGKTTTLRMVTGLIRPDAGQARLFGEPVAPGAAVLARLGCFIEGPGFLPQLSGRRNLELYWATTGRRRQEARFDEVLAVADLGGAVEKPVRGYSQGMRQRLAIAQAMLGLPELLVLDEPTNGLDPPQITALRDVLRRYATSGRTVVVSSHLLAEVERTCSHVVVMSHGRVVAAGAIAEVAGGRGLESAFLDLIGATEPAA